MIRTVSVSLILVLCVWGAPMSAANPSDPAEATGAELQNTEENSAVSADETSSAAEKLSKKEQRAARRAELKAQVDALLERPPEDADYSTTVRCLSTNRIRSIDVLDDQHVAIRVNRREYYLVQFERRCPGLRHGDTVIYETRGGWLCSADGIRTVYGFGPRQLDPGVECFIPGFQTVTEEQVKSLKAILKNRRNS